MDLESLLLHLELLLLLLRRRSCTRGNLLSRKGCCRYTLLVLFP